MKQSFACGALIGLVGALTSFAPPLGAHGSGGGGPGIVPPPQPPAVGPAPFVQGPGTQAPSSPAAPGPSSGTPSPAAPGSNQGGGPSTPGAESPDLASWRFWWNYNWRPYLELKARVHSGGVVTGSDDFFLGRGEDGARGSATRPDAVLIHGQIAPVLRGFLKTEKTSHVLTSSMLSLAKVGDDPQGQGSAVAAILPLLGHSNVTVSEVAALSLGIHGREDSAFLLADLLADNERGRALNGGARVGERVRAFAAYGMGQIGQRTGREEVRRFIVSKLATTYENGSGGFDVRVACLLSMGLVPLPSNPEWAPRDDGYVLASNCLEAQIAWARVVLDAEDWSALDRAHAPTTMARLAAAGGSGEVREAVARVLIDYLGPHAKAPREVEQSCAQGLGFLGDGDEDELDRDIRETLFAVPRNVSDRQARAFALISLAQVASRPGGGEGDPLAGATEVRKHLARELARGKSFIRPWAAMAAGVLERGLADAGVITSTELAEATRAELAAARSPENVGALCISLGLQGDPQAIPLLIEVVAESSEPQSRGFAMIALGLLEANEGIEVIQSTLEDSKYRAELVRDAALGLGLMRNPKVTASLVDMLRDSKSLTTWGGVCYSLGQLGDANAADPLLELALDTSRPAIARGLAAEALGGIADREDLPWNTALSVGTNYRANPSTLSDPDVVGVLDLY